MAEKIISKRVVFPKGKQKSFFGRVMEKISVDETAKICKLSARTIRDWRREKFLMDFSALRKVCKKINIALPSDIKLKDKYWYVMKGCSAGGKAVWKKYGRIGNNPAYRKKKWREWWEREGKYKPIPFFNLPKPIKKPVFSKDLAEFVGIMLGDGGIWKYQIYITLHDKDDKKYSFFVVKLIKRLFGVPVTIFRRKSDSTIRILVSRIALVNFCAQKLGLKIGNKIKQQVDIPIWIKNNKNFSIACARGLFDTDGCVFTHHYIVNGKHYNYKKISFTSHSKPLLQSVFKVLDDTGIKTRITKNGKDIRIDGQNDVKRYFKIVGSNNPKYLKKYRN